MAKDYSVEVKMSFWLGKYHVALSACSSRSSPFPNLVGLLTWLGLDFHHTTYTYTIIETRRDKTHCDFTLHGIPPDLLVSLLAVRSCGESRVGMDMPDEPKPGYNVEKEQLLLFPNL